ncbi:MAG: AAA family ATPase [Anaerolineae bacterium]|nr:AAA family ATPase [Candidatus Roseilinea sp.]MDW8449587.1 AAA family ATPase [Anaerolineae bacterium]
MVASESQPSPVPPDAVRMIPGEPQPVGAVSPSPPVGGPAADGQPSQDLAARLSTFCTDLTQLALDGKLSVAYGRDAEVEEALRALASPGTLFPMLTGGPRSGKTTVAHHVANRIVRAECPEPLQGLRVYETTPSRLINGLGGLHQWMSEINGLLALLAQSNVVLFLRDFHTALGLGIPPGESGPDLASALGDLLQSAHPRMLFEARSRGLERLFTEAPALRSLFAPIKVDAMMREAAAAVIRRAAEDLEIIHEVGIGEDACDEALELAARFLLNEALPGSALDMLKDTLTTAGAGNGGTKTLTRADVRHRFIQRSGLPEFLVNDDAPYDEEAARKFLTQRVFGQEVAVEAVLRMIALVRARLNNPQRPMGVFLFLGPTGVGKTELVKALARFLFGGEERIVRFNMADFNNPWTAVDRMFGDPHGSTELERLGMLSARMAQQTFAVLLLDEFEKAIPDMYQRFLQLFDEGILINGQGEELNLRNTVIVLTSNLGAQLLNPQLGFRVGDPVEEAERAIIRESEAYFRPEFINRLDAVCFFKPLSRNVIRQIAQREVNDVIAREGIVRRGLRVSVDDSVIDLLVERGYDLRFGARYLKRQIERSITYPLARQIARKRLPDGATVRLIARGGEIAVWVVDEGGENGDSRLEMRDAISFQSLPAKELRARLDALGERVERMMEQHHIAELKARVSAMIERIGQPDFWQHPQEATAQIEAMNLLSQRVDQAENVRRLFEQCDGALKRVAAARGKAAAGDLAEANRLYAELARELPLAETMLCLRSDEDQAGAFVTVRAIVAANEDAALPAEWARDLALMYAEWAKARGFPVALVNEATAGDGVLEATINITGFGAYALLKGETGSHRLVRQSPKRDGERVSVWARVEVFPDAPVAGNAANEVRIEHRPLREPGVLTNKLLRQTTITLGKLGEAGGRRTLVWRHALPADEIEGHARRYVPRWLNAQQQLARVTQAEGDEPLKLADQVRTYTLFKQASVKDARTGLTSTQPKKVLAGALDEFLIAYLTASLG